MIRESTNASSVFALASLRSDGQAQSIWRTATGAEASASALVGGTGFPEMGENRAEQETTSALIIRVNVGDAWAQLGAPLTITMSPNAQIGLFVCAHKGGDFIPGPVRSSEVGSSTKTKTRLHRRPR